MEKLQNVLEEKRIQKWFQKDNLIILVLAGVLLLVINLPTEKKQAESNKNATEAGTMVSVTEERRFGDLYEYTEYLEEKLETILVNMKGVGRVKVMLTLETSEEQVVEKDEPITRDNTTETDTQGGNRNIYKMDSGQETVFMKQGNDEIPYVSKTVLPKISGVLIIAQGAGTGNNSKNISEIAQALFGVDAHKIKVVPMAQ